MIGLSFLIIGIILFIVWWIKYGKWEVEEDVKETYGELKSSYRVDVKKGLHKIEEHEEYLGGDQ